MPSEILPAETVIRSMVAAYFQGLHRGESDRLAPLFHRDCVLKTPGLRRDMATWLSDVASRPIPQLIGQPFDYRIIWLEIEGDQAMVKVHCPLPHGNFVDYLGFLKEDNVWKIVNKMYAVASELNDPGAVRNSNV